MKIKFCVNFFVLNLLLFCHFRSVLINSYNKDILNVFEANMDIQPVMGFVGLAKYLCKYLFKPDNGLSKFLQKAKDDIDNGNMDIYQRFRIVANAFLNGNLSTAQEASAFLLGFRTADSSRTKVFLPTYQPDDRVHLLKNQKELKKLDPESVEIYQNDIFKKYERRTAELDHLCLAEFAANYSFVQRKCHEEFDIDDDDAAKDFMERKTRRTKIINFCNYKIHQDAQNYYREQLLLYLPFRNELEEIQNVNWHRKFQANSSTIFSNKMKYSKLTDEEEQMLYQKIEEENETNNDEDEGFNSFDLPDEQLVDIIQQGGTVPQIKPNNRTGGSTWCPELISEVQLFNDLRALNEKQREIVQHVYKCDVNNIQQLVILLGSAGVGKSMVIRVISNLITRRHNRLAGSRCDALRVLLTCYTGKGAQEIGGTTLHSAFSMQARGERVGISENVKNTLSVTLNDVKYLVIDEISFVSSNFLVDVFRRISSITKSTAAFGGWSTFLVGDLHQLPPVSGREVFERSSTKDLEVFIQNNYVWNLFSMYELDEIMRQKDDRRFIEALNNIAKGIEEFTEDDERLFQSRVIDKDSIPDDCIILCCVNRLVHQYNGTKMDQLSRIHHPEEFLCQSIDKIDKTSSSKLAKRKLDEYYDYIKVELEPSKAQNYCPSLRLQIGFKYMIICNIDINDRLINGAVGILRRVSFSEDNDLKILWFEFENDRVGVSARSEYKNYMIQRGIAENLVPITKKSVTIEVREYSFSFSRKQFPVMPAWAMTIHKSQGSTFDKVCVDFSGSEQIRKDVWRLFYVAFSRVKKLEGLYIVGSFSKEKMRLPKKDESKVSIEMKRLREGAKLKLCFNNFKSLAADDFPIVYLNVNSLIKKLPDIICDRWYMSAKMLVFSETKTNNREDIVIQNFSTIFRSDHKDRNTYGVICLARNDVLQEIRLVSKFEDEGGKLDLVLFQYNGEDYILTGYRSPTYSITDFKRNVGQFLQNVQPCDAIHVIGDFNIDMYGGQKYIFTAFNIQGLKGVMDQLESTHGFEYQIDVVLSNRNYAEGGSYPTYFSDHFAVYLILYGDKSYIACTNQVCFLFSVFSKKFEIFFIFSKLLI